MLDQISDALEKKELWQTKGLTSISPQSDVKIVHKPCDDLESLFYVLFWISVLYDSPGQERLDFNFEKSILNLWTESAYDNLAVARGSKDSFILKNNFDFQRHLPPYFHDLIPLLEAWRQLFRRADTDGLDPSIEATLDVVNEFLQSMSQDEERQVMEQKLHAIQNSLPNLDSTPASQVTTRSSMKKRQRETRSAGDSPGPFQSKRQK